MRLRNDHRDDIRSRTIAASFDAAEVALAAQGSKLGLRFYEETLSETERRAANKLPRKWVMRTTHLKFTTDQGVTLSFEVDKEVVVPTNGNYGTLGRLSIESSTLAIAHHDNKNEQHATRKEAARQLSSLLNSAQTLAQLKDLWPEGHTYYAHLEAGLKLPTPTAKRVNLLLGLKAA